MNFQLEAKVKAQNIANGLANNFYSYIKPYFQKLIGLKVVNRDGSFIKALHEVVNDWTAEVRNNVLKDNVRFHSIVYNTSNVISFTITTSCNVEGKNCCVYANTNFFIGDLVYDSLNLNNVFDLRANFKTNFSVTDVLVLRKRLEEAENQVSKIKAEMYPFGKFDN